MACYVEPQNTVTSGADDLGLTGASSIAKRPASASSMAGLFSEIFHRCRKVSNFLIVRFELHQQVRMVCGSVEGAGLDLV